ncbi:hypothetical protein VFPBJ_11657 [Purpureocillium lilacinum]|uniref:Uncharacterized protein n=1 Tax=Purpureocillium lilacinum TaxID=33203 RepID=A0A179F0I5_PURLI|nr:hypothetical protein VFPBJ_11657 [Purpureocillium lilacinum]
MVIDSTSVWLTDRPTPTGPSGLSGWAHRGLGSVGLKPCGFSSPVGLGLTVRPRHFTGLPEGAFAADLPRLLLVLAGYARRNHLLRLAEHSLAFGADAWNGEQIEGHSIQDRKFQLVPIPALGRVRNVQILWENGSSAVTFSQRNYNRRLQHRSQNHQSPKDLLAPAFPLQPDGRIRRTEYMLGVSIHNCWSKLNEYYTLLEQSPLYPASVILHPRWNVSWLEANWTSHEQLIWLRDAKRNVREYFESHYPSVESSIVTGAMFPRPIRKEESRRTRNVHVARTHSPRQHQLHPVVKGPTRRISTPKQICATYNCHSSDGG